MKKVVKFGGSSLAGAGQFKKVADIIHSDKARRYVVVSAPGKLKPTDEKITDMLYQMYDANAAGKSYKAVWKKIKEKYLDIAGDLKLTTNLEYEFGHIEEEMLAGAGRAFMASRGEYLCALLMSEYLGVEFIDAKDVIYFHNDGRCDFDKTNEELSARLETTKKCVIPGFYGINENGEIVTFSRGGSDVTGSLVAKAVQADEYENWTDVSGFLIADPRIVKNPEVISTITYSELRELAYMGASVLHEDAFFPVRKDGIPIHIKNTNFPGDDGTLIVEATSKKAKYTITGIAGKKGFCSVNIDKTLMNSEVGFCMKVLNVFADNGLSIEHMPSGIDTMSVLVHESEFVDKEQRVIAGIHRAVAPDSINVEPDLGLIAVVGRCMKEKRGTAGRIFSALGHEGINIRMIDQGSSELNIIIGVKESDFDRAIQAIYSIFVTTEA